MMSSRTPGGVRSSDCFFRGALIAVGALWLGLLPWRPVLAGDDFGYYDSVVQILREGRVVTSDWLNPFSVGLTVPAALLVDALGDLWLGCTLTVGFFGCLGLWTLGHLLRQAGITPTGTAMAVVVWALYPGWLTKWTHFESAVPATSLMLVALICYLSALRAGPARLWLLVGGGIALAWAVSIRQNHLVLVLAGAAGCLLAGGPRRVGEALVWGGPSVVMFGWLTYGLPKTFAQEHMMAWQLSQTTLAAYGARFVRGGFFALGAAVFLLGVSRPAHIRALWRHARASHFGWGVAALLALLVAASRHGSAANWLAPTSDFLLFARMPWLLGSVTCLGALAAPLLLACLWQGRQLTTLILAASAVGYVSLVSLWGYWEYYFLEVILLLWLTMAGSSVPSADFSESGGRRGAVQWAVLGVYLCAAWYGQRVLIDLQAGQTQVVEGCFRAGLVQPATSRGVPFGVLGWNLFPSHVHRWRAAPEGSPLDFSSGRKIEAHFRWRADAATLSTVPTLRHGVIRVGFLEREWQLLGAVSPLATADGHRVLPLTPAEWREFRARPN